MIAESFTNYGKIQGWEVESLDLVHGDVEYIYYIWQCHGKSEPWISIFTTRWVSQESCVFVGTPDMLLKKYAPEQIETEEFLCDECGYYEDAVACHYEDCCKLSTNDDG